MLPLNYANICTALPLEIGIVQNMDWTGQLDWTIGLDSWTGQLDWTVGLDYWTGILFN